MERVFKLVRSEAGHLESGELGMVCNERLPLYFEDVECCPRMNLVLSTEETPDSYGVKSYDNCHLIIKGQEEREYVSSYLVTAIERISEVEGCEWVYLSMEFPEEEIAEGSRCAHCLE